MPVPAWSALCPEEQTGARRPSDPNRHHGRLRHRVPVRLCGCPWNGGHRESVHLLRLLARLRDLGTPPALDSSRQNDARMIQAANQVQHSLSRAQVDERERVAHFSGGVAADDGVAESQLTVGVVAVRSLQVSQFALALAHHATKERRHVDRCLASGGVTRA